LSTLQNQIYVKSGFSEGENTSCNRVLVRRDYAPLNQNSFPLPLLYLFPPTALKEVKERASLLFKKIYPLPF